jgi:hypothetical protein
MNNMKKKKPFIAKQTYDPIFLKNGERHKGSKKNGWLKHWKEKKVFKFTWDYCPQCDGMFVRCPMCGNNCCNAGFGKVKSMYEPAWMGDEKAKECPVCNLAYAYQDLAYKHKDVPKVSKKEKKEKQRKNAEFWSKFF